MIADQLTRCAATLKADSHPLPLPGQQSVGHMDNKRTETSAGRAAARTRAFLPPPPSLLLVLLLLLLARCAAAQGPLEYRREISSGNSSLDSARSAVVSVNSIKFT